MTAYRYWRLNIASSQGGSGAVYIDALEMRETAGGPNLSITGNGTASASVGGGSAPMAFDGISDDGIHGWYSSAQVCWIGWDFGVGAAYDIQHLTLDNDKKVGTGMFVKTAMLQGSADGTTWVDRIYVAGTVSTDPQIFAPRTGSSELTAPAATAVFYGGICVNIPCPVPALHANGGASAAVVCPSQSLALFGGGYAPIAAPKQVIHSSGHNSAGENDAAITAPSPSIAASCGAHADLSAPSPTIALTATATSWGKSVLDAPAPTLAAAGTVSGVGDFRQPLLAPRPKLIGYGGAVCSITPSSAPTLQASGTAGSTGHAAVSCPLFELTASGTAQNFGGASLLCPSPRLGATLQAYLIAPSAALTAIGSAVVTATDEAYAINLNHAPSDQAPVDEVTRFTNFPFTHVVRYQNSYFGVAADGLYLLEGTTDDGAAIEYAIRTCPHDFGATQKKTIASAYFGARFGPTATVSVYAGEKAPVAYHYATPRDTRAQNHRQAFGRGIKERYLAVGVTGTDAMQLDSIEFEVGTMKRRI